MVDLRNAVGVQLGDHNTQQLHLPPFEIPWPVQVGVVRRLADAYQGRPESELLCRAVDSEGTAVVSQVLAGLGGVGKSQLAAALATERRTAVDLLVWTDARNRAAVVAGYAQAAAQLGYRQLGDVEAAARWFLGWLQRTEDRSWLVVLDDVADPVELHGLWPAGPRGNVVVTTRRTDAAVFAGGRQQVSVGLFSPEQARRYLTERLAIDAGSSVLDEVDQLTEDLQFLPLALAQAAAFILDRDETCSGYRRRFANRRRMLTDLFPADAAADEYGATVATTWAISVEAADSLAPVGLSRPLLEVGSMLSPTGIPGQILSTPDVAAYLAARTNRGRTDEGDSPRATDN